MHKSHFMGDTVHVVPAISYVVQSTEEFDPQP